MRENMLPEEFFYDLAARASDRMMEELPSEEELSRKLTFSPAFERRMELFLANPRSARAHDHRAWRVLAIAAAVIILLISALMSVSAVREAVFKFFATIYEKYIVVWYVPEDDMLTAPEVILEFREPTYIPLGYNRTSEEKTELFHVISYMNADGHVLLFEQTILDKAQYALDIEAAVEKELFEINGTTGMYTIINNELVMVWADNHYAFKLKGMLNTEQALMMVHSTK